MLAWVLLSLVAADTPSRTHQAAVRICNDLADAACDYQSRCSGRWRDHGTFTFDACRQDFDIPGCAGKLELELDGKEGASQEIERCMQQLYPGICVYAPDEKTTACAQAYKFLPAPSLQPKELVDNKPKPEAPEPPQAPDVAYPWLFPVQGSLSVIGELANEGTTFGGNFYVGWSGGRVLVNDAFADKEGPFVGIGLAGFFGTTDIPDCGRAVRCGYRSWLGPGVRLGWAQWNRRKLVDRLQVKEGHNAGNVVWSDTYYFVQVTPFFGGEHLTSAPLAPAETALLHGVRFDLGVNSVELTRTVFHILAQVLSGAKGDAAAVALFLLPLALLNHLEFNVEWSNPALSPGGWRVGVSMGTGF